MLRENIKVGRRSKGLSQDELAVKLNVVRQTVSKWERGLSIPDSEMLVSLSDTLEIPVSKLIGENIEEAHPDDLKVISQKLEVINFQLAKRKNEKRRIANWILVTAFILLAVVFLALLSLKGTYLYWDYSKPDLAIAGTLIHGFEWLFIRLLPLGLIGLIIAAIIIRKRK